jgi:chromosome segregation ATPase
MPPQKDSSARPLAQVLKNLRHCLDQWSGELYYHAFFDDPTLSQDWEGLYDRTLACEARLARGLEKLQSPLDEFRQTVHLVHATCEGWSAMAQRLSELTKHPGAARALETLKEALDRPEYNLPQSVLAQDARFSAVILELHDSLEQLGRSLGPGIVQARMDLEKAAEIRRMLEQEAAAAPRLQISLERSQAELAKAREELERAAAARAELETKLSQALAQSGEIRRSADEDLARRDEQARRDFELRRKLEQDAAQSARARIELEGELQKARQKLEQEAAQAARARIALEDKLIQIRANPTAIEQKLRRSQTEMAQLRTDLEQAHAQVVQAQAQAAQAQAQVVEAQAQADKTAGVERALAQAWKESEGLKHQLERSQARIAKLSAELEAAFRGEKASPGP